MQNADNKNRKLLVGSQQRRTKTKTHAILCMLVLDNTSNTSSAAQQLQRVIRPLQSMLGPKRAELKLHGSKVRGVGEREEKRIISGLKMPRRPNSVGREGKRGFGQLTFQLDIDLTGHPAVFDTFLFLSTRVCEIFPADNRRIRGMKRPQKPIVAVHRVKDG